MGAHIVEGEFQSDKYPTCPRGKVPLSARDPTAQDLLWEYARRRRSVDSEFSDDLEAVLRAAGYDPKRPTGEPLDGVKIEATAARCPVHAGMIHGGEAEELRAGIERILEGNAKVGKVLICLQRLLDRVDARDSLGHLEGEK